MSAPRAARRIIAGGALALAMLLPSTGNAGAAQINPTDPATATPKQAASKRPVKPTTAQPTSAANPAPRSTQEARPQTTRGNTAPPARAKTPAIATPNRPTAKTATAKVVAAKPVSSSRSSRSRRPQTRRAQARGSGKVIYLTFDDGPSRVTTPQVLALLKKYDAKATFFMVGGQAAGKAAMVRQVRAAGHAVGNHTYSHPNLTKLTSRQISRELHRTDALVGRTRCMRPPGGATNVAVASVALSEGKRVILWNVDTVDWRRPGANAIVARTLKTTRSGSIVLMHDGGGPREQTVQALKAVLPRLASQGYRFASLPSCR